MNTALESAFIKGGTRINLAHIGTPDYLRTRLPELQQVRVRIELDTDPPPLADYELLTLLTPVPFQVRLFDLPCLFAGKLHAILCRDWKSRVKGRDFYDFVWYLGRQVPCNLGHLQARMTQTGHGRRIANLTSRNCASFCCNASNRLTSIRRKATYARSCATRPSWSYGTAPSSNPWPVGWRANRLR